MIIRIIVTVMRGAGALQSCGCLWFIKTCSSSTSAFSHIPQRVKLFVSGCVVQRRVEKLVSQPLPRSGIEAV